MSKQIPKEKLDFLNSLLDKELEGLEQPINTNFWNISNQKEESFNVDNELQCHQTSKFEVKGEQLSSEIASLQSKLTNLEFKITSYDTNPMQNQFISPNLPLQMQHHHSESEDQTPLKNVYRDGSSTKKRIKFQDDFDNRESRRPKTQKAASPARSSVRDTKNQTLTRTNKFELERSIEEAENRLHQSKTSLKRSHSRKESFKARSSSAASRHNLSNDANQQDLGALQRKLQQMKKAQDEERQILIKEKQKNQQLLIQIQTLNKQVKKLSQNTDKNSQLELDYKRLLENFEKSEYIRQQQKTLIGNLKLEIENLKNEGLKSEPLKDVKNQTKKKKKI